MYRSYVRNLISEGKCTLPCKKHSSQDKHKMILSTQQVHSSRFLFKPFTPLSSSPCCPEMPGNNCSDFYHYRLVLHILNLHMDGITRYVVFCIWLHLKASVLLCVSAVHHLLLLHSIPLQEHTTVRVFILLKMNIWIVSSLGLLWIKHKHSCANLFDNWFSTPKYEHRDRSFPLAADSCTLFPT